MFPFVTFCVDDYENFAEGIGTEGSYFQDQYTTPFLYWFPNHSKELGMDFVKMS